MGKQVGPVFITGTVGGKTYYKMDGEYYVRAKSSLSRKRVKRSPRFRRTMEYAEWLAQASKIASGIYRLLPLTKRRLKDYRAITGAAMQLLKEGIDKELVQAELERKYKKEEIKQTVVIHKKASQQGNAPVIPGKDASLYSNRQRAWLRNIKAAGSLRTFIRAPDLQRRGQKVVPRKKLKGSKKAT